MSADKEAIYWQRIADKPEYKQLVKAKKGFIIPATIFYLVYYFTLPYAAGYLPGIMNIQVIGSINVGYVFALSQFFMAWILAYMYAKKAGSVFDALSEKIVSDVKGGR